MKNIYIISILLMVQSLLCVSCSNNNNNIKSLEESSPSMTRIPPRNEKGNGVYHWKTLFNLSDYERSFLKEHDIKYLYVRMFDVDYGEDFDGTTHSVPIATTRFLSQIPSGIEVIPVVYITQSAIKKDSKFAQVLYKRIRAMGKRNGFLDKIREIQLDCDWASRTEENFFQLCKEVVSYAHKDNIQVSATIRLHQLNQKVPPVDKGVLMLYNTGSLYDQESENSILSYDDVAPYLKTKVKYELPISMAYPIYSWGLLFRNNKFVCILHHTNFTNNTFYKQLKGNRFRVNKTHYIENIEIRKGDVIRFERPIYNEILNVKSRVSTCLVNQSMSNIIYHLDSLGISSFSSTEFNNILK